jgi:hypothetical protein
MRRRRTIGQDTDAGDAVSDGRRDHKEVDGAAEARGLVRRHDDPPSELGEPSGTQLLWGQIEVARQNPWAVEGVEEERHRLKQV